MILIAPYNVMQQVFRKQEAYVDEDGVEQTRTVRVGTGRKLEDGTTLSDVDATLFGEPVVEATDSATRRMAFSHYWSEDELRWIREVFIESLNNPSPKQSVFLLEEMPADWVYPPEEPIA